MLRNKPAVLLFICSLFIYGHFTVKYSPLGNTTERHCNNALLNLILPWDSGCRLSEYFETQPNFEKVSQELRHISNFQSKGGVAPHVHYYHLQLSKRFSENLGLDYEDLVWLQKEYTKHNPGHILHQYEFIKYLSDVYGNVSAQKYLNDYCDRYIDERSLVLLQELEYRILVNELKGFQFSQCIELSRRSNSAQS